MGFNRRWNPGLEMSFTDVSQHCLECRQQSSLVFGIGPKNRKHQPNREKSLRCYFQHPPVVTIIVIGHSFTFDIVLMYIRSLFESNHTKKIQLYHFKLDIF